MVKNIAALCIAKVTKKVQKQAFDKAMNELKDGAKMNAEMSHMALTMVGNVPDCSGPRPREDEEGDKQYPDNYRSLVRLPKTDMRKLLLKVSAGREYLSEAKILLWKLRDPNIEHNLFMFDYSLDLKSKWEKGDLRIKWIFNEVLTKWQYNQGGSAIARVGEAFKNAGPLGPPWATCGVFAYDPPGDCQKTHVIHTASGKKVPLPQSLPADETWTFKSNWSVLKAEACNATGEHGRPVMSFWKESHEIDASTWPDFSVNAAHTFRNEQESTQEAALSTTNLMNRFEAVMASSPAVEETTACTPPVRRQRAMATLVDEETFSDFETPEKEEEEDAKPEPPKTKP